MHLLIQCVDVKRSSVMFVIFIV